MNYRKNIIAAIIILFLTGVSSCKKDPIDSVINLENTAWLREKMEKKEGDEWKEEKELPFWMQITKDKIIDRNNSYPYSFNTDEKTVTLLGNNFFISKFTATQMIWENNNPKTLRMTYKKIPGADPTKLLGKWNLTERGIFNKTTKEWKTATSTPELRLKFDSPTAGTFYPNSSTEIPFTCTISINVFDGKFPYGKSFITELTGEKMMFIWVDNKGDIYKYGFVKAK